MWNEKSLHAQSSASVREKFPDAKYYVDSVTRLAMQTENRSNAELSKLKQDLTTLVPLNKMSTYGAPLHILS